MFTSGSTGQAKGVAMSQRQLLNRFNWLWQQYPFTNGEVACQRTTVNFIPSLWEMLGALLRGVPTVILPDAVIKDPQRLLQTLAQEKITRIGAVPALLKMLLDLESQSPGLSLHKRLPHLKLWFTAGEVLTAELYRRFRQALPDAVLSNDYGSTETNGVLAFDSRWQRGELSSVPAGRPIANAQAYILDDNLQPVAAGATGELYIGGIPASGRYLNKPAWTAEKFIPDPFSAQPGGRLYKTGDSARFLPNSDGHTANMVEVLGRRDQQVKIRGVRVELGNIEAVLARHPLVRDNAVGTYKKKSGDIELAAYVELKAPCPAAETPATQTLRDYLAAKLPAYMLPALILIVERLPRTPNGKIDRKNLPVPASVSVADISPAFDNRDSRLADSVKTFLQEKILQTLEVAPGHPFDRYASFTQLGLYSTALVRLAHLLSGELGFDVDVTTLYEYPGIEPLSEYLCRVHSEKLACVFQIDHGAGVPAPRPTPVPEGGQTATAAESDAPVFATDIAIIGAAERYPQADNLTEFWLRLAAGENCIKEIPAERWEWRSFYSDEKARPGKSYTRWGGFIRDADKFDPLFFHISPKEAEQMDPQERVFLETAYAAIEDAGYTAENLAADRKVGVFVGVMNSSYNELASYWSIANRVSYCYDFRGPSLALDSACSSSLTAIHLAMESLIRGDCRCAIAGGVNLIVRPAHHIRLSAMTMVTPAAECKSFGAGADGFVDGEGVGALLIKPLQRAQADSDHIYAVIKGSAISAGGKTQGYTVPSPAAQRQVIQEALAKARLQPWHLSYIEAHGTGTDLGDPIEIAGLTQVFNRGQQDWPHTCALGSVKSNIGHCESAAGIAGVTKVLLQMRHRRLVPSLHSSTLNPNIDFAATPFNVQQTLEDWQPQQPRIAGVSSFGAGGANAHIILQEYVSPAGRQQAPVFDRQYPAIIVLSAKSEAQLIQIAKNLLQAIATQSLTEEDFPNLVYTLQVGREAMEERLAFTVASLAETVDRLNTFVSGNASLVNCYRGSVNESRETLDFFKVDDDAQSLVASWLAKGKYGQLLGLWVKGLVFDWQQLYPHANTPQRISLPTYPFARERYWLTQKGVGKRPVMHPLVHENTSTLSEQRFSSTFTGEEFFLTDHRLNGEKILPGAACFEMIRAAVMQATGEPAPDHCLQLKHMVWARPICVGETPQVVHIGLYPEENGDIGCEIYTPGEQQESEPVVHSQGVAAFSSAVEIPILNLRDLQIIIPQYIGADQYYEMFKRKGFEYGLAHRGLREIRVGNGEVLARLVLPSAAAAINASFILHPSLMDAALQAAIGLIENATIKSVFPFALESLVIFNPCRESMWAWVRNAPAADRLQKLDIDLCDEAGHICVSLKGLSFRAVDSDVEHIAAGDGEGDSRPAETPGADSLTEKEAAFAGQVIEYFKRQLAGTIKLPVQRIRAQEPFEKYGIDSVMAMQLTNELERTFGALSKTLFFEYRTIEEISHYFIEDHRPRLLKLLQADKAPVVPDNGGSDNGGVRNSAGQSADKIVTAHTPALRKTRRHRFGAGMGNTLPST